MTSIGISTPALRRGAFLAALLVAPGILRAGSTGSVRLLMPQGSGAGSANGDFIASTNNGAIDTYYSYYVEVPSGLSRLRIQLFDADIGDGPGTQENGNGTAGRDRSRGNEGFNTAATYSLIDANGTPRTVRFTSGDAAGPAGADNAWLTFYDSNDSVFPTLASSQTATKNDGGGTTIAVARPAGLAVGDLMLAYVARSTNTGTIGSAPTGWSNSIGQGACGTAGGANSCRLAIFYKVADAGDVAAANFTFNLGSTREAVAAIARYTDVDPLNPIDASGFGSGGQNTSAVAPGVGASANTRVIRVVAAGDNSALSGWTGEYLDFNVNSNSGLLLGAAQTTQAGAGGTGTATATISSSENWASATVTLNSAARIVNGHWELRVDESSTVTGGNDLNGLGIRADDGDESTAGTELNVYYETSNQIGVHSAETAGDTKLYTFYPYVTLGCTMSENDFDNDNGNGTYNGTPTPLSLLASRSVTPVFTQTFPTANLSADNVWVRNTTNQFTSNGDAIDYGIWKSEERINTYDNNAGTNGNYATIWFGSSAAPANPPASNQISGGYRVYLSKDGINAAGTPTAPVKTYLEQQVRCINSSGGVCPTLTTNGTPRTYQVTVRLVNPEAQAVTFSTPTSVITAVVPGAPVTYVAGSAAVTTGGTVSTNTVGTTTTLTWNPGTVAAGATHLLTYRVLVTPNATTTYAVTGTGATGTTGLFVDNTGNTSQARAKTTLGPLCVLQVGTAITTPAIVTDVRAEPGDGGVVVSWTTASEVGTTSFDVLRYDPSVKRFVKVNERSLFALVGAPQGGTYRFLDSSAPTEGWLRYAILEHESDGSVRRHGPYRIAVSDKAPRGGVTAALATGDFDVHARPLVAAADLRMGVVHKAPARSYGRPLAAGVTISVTQNGVYSLSAQDIAGTLGWTLEGLRKAIASHTLQLTNRGQEIGWLPGNGYDSILFYGQESSSPFTAQNVYRLAYNVGVPPLPEEDLSAPPSIGGSFRSDIHAEQQVFAAPVAATDPGGDLFYWAFVIADDPSLGRAAVTVNLPALAAGGTAHLRLKLHGATNLGIEGEHHARVTVNGSGLGDLYWNGLADAVLEGDVPASALRIGANQVEIEGLLDPGVSQNIFYLDAIDVAYDRDFTASPDGLLFRGNGQPAVTISGLNSPDVTIWDVTDATRPAPVRGSVDLRRIGSTVSLAPSAGAQYLAFTPSAVRAPDGFGPYQRTTLLDESRAADEVMIAPAAFVDTLETLARHRRAQGLRVEVVPLEDIWEAFGDGMSDPSAIRSFLAATRQFWQEPAPRYVLLAGAGSYDYRNVLRLNGNLIPPMLAPSDHGLFADDAALVDFDGNGVPELEIGRIPATTVGELSAAIEKLLAYESAEAPSWAGVALLAADADADTDFSADGAEIASALGSAYSVDRIELRTQPIDSARSQLFEALGIGAGLFNYVGHGALDRFSSLGLLTSDDVGALTNSGKTPIVTAFTCLINRFEVPGFAPLGARLLSSQNGAVAVLAPSGLSRREFGRDLGIAFYRAFAAGGDRLGDIVHTARVTAMAEAGDLGASAYYNLLGDPAMLVRRAALPSGGSGSGTRE